MRNFLLVLFLGIALGGWSQQPLIGIKNGQWIIFDGSTQHKLPIHYYDVGNFDEQGFTYFAANGKYGLINAAGEEVLPPAYTRIESFGWGCFGGITEEQNVLIHLKDEVTLDSCRSWDRVDDYWAVFYKKGEKTIHNFPSGKTITLDSTTTLEGTSLGYVSVAYDDALKVFDPKGNVINLAGGSASFQEEYVRLKSNAQDLLVLSNRQFILPLGVKRFKYDGTFFQYSTDYRTVRMDKFGKIEMDVPFSNIVKAGYDRFIFRKDGKSGIIDGKGNILVSAKYLFINATRNGYFITQENGQGLMSASGEEVVPCKYESIKKQGNLYIVESKAGLFGVYSTIVKQEIVPTKFRRITISEDRIRGWLGETLQIAYYNEAHEIEKRITLKNTVSRFSLADGAREFDERLLSVGWFFEEQPMFDEEGFNVGSQRKWGIQDPSDSILAPPRFPDPKYIPSANFSLIPMGAKETEFMGRKLRKENLFTAIDLTTGRIIGNQIYQIDTTDALSRDYMRFSSSNGFGYFTRDNKIHYVLHFDREPDTYLRFTTSPTQNYTVLEEQSRESVRLSTYQLNDPDNPSYQSWNYRDKRYDYVALTDAQWNFLQPNGLPLFETSFDYADRFFLTTAIVKKDGKWGVVNADSMIIANRFNQVVRMKEFNDTVFLVRRGQNGKRFLDRTSNEIPLNITKVLHVENGYSIVDSGRKQMVINDLYKVISDDSERYRPLNEDYYHSRKNRKSYVYDAQGSELAEIGAKSRDVFFDHLILYRDGARYGMVNDRGDTLLTNEYKSIQVYGNFILANGPDTRIFNRDGELIYQYEFEKVFIDSVTNRIAVNKNGKITIYEADGTKVTKVKNIDPDAFINNMLFDFGGSGTAVSVDETIPNVEDGVRSVVSAGPTGYLLETRNGWRIVDRNWGIHSGVGKGEYEKCSYLGEGVIYMKKDNYLFSARYGKHAFNGSAVKGFDSGLLLVNEPREDRFHYVTAEGEDPFDQYFKDAKPFRDGYAAVKMKRGWTIIDANGRTKSLDSYGEIEVHGNGLFSTESASLYGMIDHHGTVILPTDYERIKIIHNRVIQAVKNGEILYFELNGTPIEY